MSLAAPKGGPDTESAFKEFLADLRARQVVHATDDELKAAFTAGAQVGPVRDFAMAIRMLVSRLKRASSDKGDHDLAERMIDLLRRHGQQGSPLRRQNGSVTVRQSATNGSSEREKLLRHSGNAVANALVALRGNMLPPAPSARRGFASLATNWENADRALAAWRKLARTSSGPNLPSPAPGFYLLVVEGDVDPDIKGPYASQALRDQAARAHRARHGEDDGIYMLDVNADGEPQVSAYSGAFFKQRQPRALPTKNRPRA
jgi:hypothetical protein